MKWNFAFKQSKISLIKRTKRIKSIRVTIPSQLNYRKMKEQFIKMQNPQIYKTFQTNTSLT